MRIDTNLDNCQDEEIDKENYGINDNDDDDDVVMMMTAKRAKFPEKKVNF